VTKRSLLVGVAVVVAAAAVWLGGQVLWAAVVAMHQR
jgi:hypothetical protein